MITKTNSSSNDGVTVVYDHPGEEGIDVPFERLAPDTLRKLIEEFVFREWSELGDDGYSLEDKVEQVLRQLRDGRARVVYDLTTET
jgi:uncharacterized protein YheU (UPF0270 family)